MKVKLPITEIMLGAITGKIPVIVLLLGMVSPIFAQEHEPYYFNLSLSPGYSVEKFGIALMSFQFINSGQVHDTAYDQSSTENTKGLLDTLRFSLSDIMVQDAILEVSLDRNNTAYPALSDPQTVFPGLEQYLDNRRDLVTDGYSRNPGFTVKPLILSREAGASMSDEYIVDEEQFRVSMHLNYTTADNKNFLIELGRESLKSRLRTMEVDSNFIFAIYRIKY